MFCAAGINGVVVGLLPRHKGVVLGLFLRKSEINCKSAAVVCQGRGFITGRVKCPVWLSESRGCVRGR
jgi:hypothetical protein